MGLSFELDPPLTDDLRAAIVALWVDVTNAGGAVGFVPPVT
ncbi:MAG TPA: GNAT family N-acetyltransferase, partial [Actinomycetes bacterium]|nr:GNAT family N-acetyltransferase [Actinomycetes bacterium]